MFILVCLGYIAFGGLLLSALGRPWPIRLATSTSLSGWTVLSSLWLLWQYLRSPNRLRAALAPQRVGGFMVVMLLIVPTQITFQALKQAIGPVVGFWLDPWLHQTDVVLHGQVAWKAYGPVLTSWPLVRAFDVLYVVWHLLFVGFLFWAAWSGHRALRRRALLAVLLVCIVAGTLSAALGASAGPCYYGQVVGGANPYTELFSRLDDVGALHGTLIASRAQAYLWDRAVGGTWGAFAGISAMPSLHVAMATLFAIVAAQRSRLLGVLLAGFAAITQVGSVVLGWHYAIDGYVGGALAVVCWMGAAVLARLDEAPGQLAP